MEPRYIISRREEVPRTDRSQSLPRFRNKKTVWTERTDQAGEDEYIEINRIPKQEQDPDFITTKTIQFDKQGQVELLHTSMQRPQSKDYAENAAWESAQSRKPPQREKTRLPYDSWSPAPQEVASSSNDLLTSLQRRYEKDKASGSREQHEQGTSFYRQGTTKW